MDWAIWLNIPDGGWCPKGRKAEDGSIGSKYLLRETPTSNYPQRTEWNVRDSDGTVIFSVAPALTGGSKKTAALAIKHKKPWLHIYRDGQYDAAALLLRFISDHEIKILNVAGPSRLLKNSPIFRHFEIEAVMFSKRQGEEKQEEFWIEGRRVSKPSSQGFYSKLNEHLGAMDFARQIWALCGPAYREESRGGRPGIDPVVYFKMLMGGFFENLRSEREIAARYEDSLSVQGFLGYGLEESTPDHSSLSVIRQRLGPEITKEFSKWCSRRSKRTGFFGVGIWGSIRA